MCEDKSCQFCVFDEKFSKYYQQLVILKKQVLENTGKEKQTRELTAYYMMFIQKNWELLKDFLNDDFSPAKPCLQNDYGY